MISNEVFRCCPICNNSRIENIKKISFIMDITISDYYYLAHCSECGFVFANTPATFDDYENYYKSNNRYSSLPTLEASSRKLYNEVSSLLARHIDKKHAVLDLGCGGGELLSYMKADGYKDLTGLDPSKESIDKLRNLGIAGIQGSIYDEPAPDQLGRFDAIILSGVLEHLYDLHQSVKAITKYLKRGGKVISFVPNTLEYYKYEFPIAHYINIEHINHFTPDTLSYLFRPYGFSMVECISNAILFGKIPDPALLVVLEYSESNLIANNSIRKLLTVSEINNKKLENKIEELIDSKRPIVVFGAGNYARTILASTRLSESNIICFVDNDKSIQNKTFCGYPVFPPDYLMGIDCDILILSMSGREGIIKQLKDMNVLNTIL